MDNYITVSDYMRFMVSGSFNIIDRLPIEYQQQSIGYITSVLATYIARHRKSLCSLMRQCDGAKVIRSKFANHENAIIGLNAPGLLLDKLAVNIVRCYMLEHRYNKKKLAKKIRNMDIPNLVIALDAFCDVDVELNRKICDDTILVEHFGVRDFVEAFFHLLIHNLMMWECNEFLFTRGSVSDSDLKEVRLYLSWLSDAELKRNYLIWECNTRFKEILGMGEGIINV